MQKILLKITSKFTILLVLMTAILVIPASSAMAADDGKCKVDGLKIPQCAKNEKQAEKVGERTVESGNNPIIVWIGFLINVLSAIILAGASIMMVWAGLQYMSARDNPQGVQAAKEKIWNIVLGLLAYFFLYAFVQWLIPGGVF